MSNKRGVFILIEGIDRSGKTTQAHFLQKALNEKGFPTERFHFPDRTTAIGKCIHTYLTNPSESLDDRAIHLLFSANRWEFADKLESLLQSGTHIVMDRYAYSGVAFSAAKTNMDVQWCWQPEIGLPRPDTIVFLSISVELASARSDFGTERYERVEFQKKVAENFEKIKEMERATQWHQVNASESMDQVRCQILNLALECISTHQHRPISRIEPYYAQRKNSESSNA